MRKRSIKNCLVIVISCLILIISISLRFSNLTEIKLFSTDLILDDSGDVDHLEGKQHALSTFLSSILSIIFHPRVDLIEHFPLFPFESTSYSQNELILRC